MNDEFEINISVNQYTDNTPVFVRITASCSNLEHRKSMRKIGIVDVVNKKDRVFIRFENKEQADLFTLTYL